MVKISSQRGTSTINAADVKNWAGETFKNFQKEQLKSAGLDTVLSQKRGTSTIVARDIPDVPQISLKGQKITTKRGTSVETL
jgi:hypothetical protein